MFGKVSDQSDFRDGYIHLVLLLLQQGPAWMSGSSVATVKGFKGYFVLMPVFAFVGFVMNILR